MTTRYSQAARGAAVAAAIVLFGQLVHAQETAYPNRPIRYVLPMPAAGPNDFLARLLAERLSKSMGQPVAVENKPGENSGIGTDHEGRQQAAG